MEFLSRIPVWGWIIIGVVVVAIVPLKLSVWKKIVAAAKKRSADRALEE